MYNNMADLHIGDSVGGIYDKTKPDGTKIWELVEDKINKITETKKDGVKYHTKKQFRPLYAEDVDSNTKIMEEAIGNGYILTREVFGLNEKTRPYAEQWIDWANKNPDKVDSIFNPEIEEERE